MYTAGNVAGVYVVRATSTLDATKEDSAFVTVTTVSSDPAPSQALAALTVSPETKSLAAGQSFKFVADGWYSGASTPHQTPVVWTATGGTVDQQGNYVAGSVAGNFVVRARSTLISWKVDSAIVTITTSGAAPPPPTEAQVVSFSLTPASVSILALGTAQFQTTTTWSDGVSRSVGVSFSATGGAIALGGLYTAGLLQGTYRVIAACDCGRVDTAVVNVSLSPTSPPPPPPPVGPGNPTPDAGSAILLDTRAGGAQSIQQAVTLQDADVALRQTDKKWNSGADPGVQVTTNVD
jgi:hypothetical protein